MSKREIKLSRRVRELEAGLRPFSKFTHVPDRIEPKKDGEIFVPTEGDVWLYIGQSDESPAHLHTDDFQLARSLVRW